MNSLLTRLVAAFLAIILGVVFGVGVALFLLIWQAPVSEWLTVTRLNEAARLALRQYPAPDLSAPQAADSYVKRLAAMFDARIVLLNDGATVLADSQSADDKLTFNLRLTRKDAAVSGGLVGRARDAKRQVWLYVAYPVGTDRQLAFAAPQTRQAVLVYFGENLLRPLVEAGAAATLLAVILAVVLARSIASPLHRMAATAQAIAHGNYAQPAPVSGPDEVRALGQALNTMAREVQAAQQTQHDFVANVSHELKTPLTSIQGFAQAILDGAVSSPEALQRSASIIYNEADRLRRLVEGLLDVTRLEAGHAAFRRAPLDLGLVLGATVEKFGLRAKEKGVVLQAQLPPQLPPMLGDADRLAQVFTNLLDNALKHTPGGGRVMLLSQVAADGVNIAVTDSGEGIPAEDLQRIFERFYQVDKSRAKPEARSGVGLGLYISKEIVDAHGGTLRAESVQGVGSRFTVWLPLSRPGDETLAQKRTAR
jgi:two-component system OmpR family sensor kinase